MFCSQNMPWDSNQWGDNETSFVVSGVIFGLMISPVGARVTQNIRLTKPVIVYVQ